MVHNPKDTKSRYYTCRWVEPIELNPVALLKLLKVTRIGCVDSAKLRLNVKVELKLLMNSIFLLDGVLIAVYT